MQHRDNSTGFLGAAVDFGPKTRIKMITIGVGDAFPVGSIFDDAIIYAADMGAGVITMNLSVSFSAADERARFFNYGPELEKESIK